MHNVHGQDGQKGMVVRASPIRSLSDKDTGVLSPPLAETGSV